MVKQVKHLRENGKRVQVSAKNFKEAQKKINALVGSKFKPKANKAFKFKYWVVKK